MAWFMVFPNGKAAGIDGRLRKRKEKRKEEEQENQQYEEEMGKITGKSQVRREDMKGNLIPTVIVHILHEEEKTVTKST